MTNDMDTQFLCKDCERYNLCKYYHGRKETSYICKFFHIGQKSGKWIIDREVIDTTRKPTTYHFDTHCSECGFKYAYTMDKEDSIPTNYCPNCGAKNGK